MCGQSTSFSSYTAMTRKAQRRVQLVEQRSEEFRKGTGQVPDSHLNPLLDRHMDLPVIRDLFFDANVRV